MIKVNINPHHHFCVNGVPVLGAMEFLQGGVTQIIGDNGVGKSSFFHYLKVFKDELLKTQKCVFLDQMRLTPLNQISYFELLESLREYRFEELDLFHSITSVVVSYGHLPIANLSGGQNQMIKIALMLYLGGDFFFMDEPFQFLDKDNQSYLKNIIKELKKKGKAIILIEHQIDLKDIIDKSFTLCRYKSSIELRG